LFKTALRGAATGVGSLGRLGVVLITGFSGSVVGLDWGFVFVVLAGFHIASTSFQGYWAVRSQLFRRLLNVLVRIQGLPVLLSRTFVTKLRAGLPNPELLDWRCLPQ
jgi:hypothetical protein